MESGPIIIFHLILILSEVILVSCFIIMIIIYDYGTDNKHKIWIGSKILTVNEIIKKNNKELYPLLNINSLSQKNEYHQNYESLLQHSSDPCQENYKKCGILDTYGNIMCIPKEDECPINDLIVDFRNKSDLYISEGYKVFFSGKLPSIYALYYSNKAIDKEIVVKINFYKELPIFINDDNLIFDESTCKEIYNQDKDDESQNGYYSFYLEVKNYIRTKFNDKINIDKSFKRIFNDLFAGNYIGFKDYNHLQNYNDINLYNFYFSIFPNRFALIFSIICSVFTLIFIAASIYLLYNKKKLGTVDDILASLKLFSLLFSIIFCGFLAYIIYKYINIVKINKPENLKNIKADIFLEDLLSEIAGRYPKNNFIFILIVLFPSSILIFIVAIIYGILIIISYNLNFKIVEEPNDMEYNIETNINEG